MLIRALPSVLWRRAGLSLPLLYWEPDSGLEWEFWYYPESVAWGRQPQERASAQSRVLACDLATLTDILQMPNLY